MGFLVANRLAKAGAAVTLSDVGPQRGAYAIEELNSLGGENIRYMNADVKSSNKMEEVISGIEDWLSPMVEFFIVEGEKIILLSIIIDNNIISVLSLLSHISIYSFQKFYSVLTPVHATTSRAAR